jgi:hypothetical protein
MGKWTYAVVCDVEPARKLLGMARSTAFIAARSGTFPGVMHLGPRRYKISLYRLAEALGCSVGEVRALLERQAEGEESRR